MPGAIQDVITLLL